MQQWGYGIYCCCNVEKDRLHPARFNLSFDEIISDKRYVYPNLNKALNFLHQVEGRPGVKLNYHLLQQFLGKGLDISKVTWMSLAVDARTELSDTRLKFYITLEDYPEKMATAIALCGENRDWKKLLVSNQLLVGFDFFLDGRAAVEVYPTFFPKELQRGDVQLYLKSILPPQALPLLEKSASFQIGISDANESDVLYFDHVFDPNSFVDNLNNEMAKKVHAYYRHQPVKALLVGIPESEFSAWSIQHLKMYYRMTDFRIHV
jgi:LynF/TruF/PatF family peptide O-prenyltransferase